VFPEQRLQFLERQYAHAVQNILALQIIDETLKVVFVLADGSTLRIVERWQAGQLIRYSYYWLDQANQLRIGWDNAPRHDTVSTHPHHRHVAGQEEIAPSTATRLEAVMFEIGDLIADDRVT
jgi:hypothetical protein